jgi:hypothetical protein
MGIADPRESAESANHDSDVRYNPHGKNSVVVHVEMAKVVHNLEQ